MCVLFTWEKVGSRTHYGKTASRWSRHDTLDDVLLEKLWVLAFMRMLPDKYHLPKHCCSPGIPCHGNDVPRWQDNYSCHAAKIAEGLFEEHKKGDKEQVKSRC